MLMPMLASAYDVKIDGVYYNLIQKTKLAEITNNNGSTGYYSGDFVIPNTVEYEGITYVVIGMVPSNGNGAFTNCSSLTSISIPNSVTYIGDYSFWGCRGLSSIDIPSSVTSIGTGAFWSCTGLKFVAIPNGVSTINQSTFYGCTGLISIEIPSTVTSIGSNAFDNCKSLASIEIPSTVISIGSGAFYNCNSLASIEIPDGVTEIGGSAFYGCSSLSSVNIPNGMTSINYRTFDGCSSLKTVTIPSSITSIGKESFKSCNSLETIIINDNIKSIDTNAFAYCKNLAEVKCYAKDVPSTSVDAFDQSMIEYCTLYVPLKSLSRYQETEPWSGFGTIKPLTDGILFKDEAVETLCLANWDTNEDGIIGMDEAAAVTDLGSVFANNSDITSFDELKYFTGLTSIGEQAFYYCSNLKSIIIPENVTTIGNRAFYVCSGLKSLRIPANVSSIEDRAFAYCSGLETIEVDGNNQYYDSRNSCNALIQTSSNTLLVGCKNSVIPDGVTSIAEGAFRGCTELTNIVIPEGVKTIGASAFRGCTGLTSVSLPSTITSIGNYAFSAFDEVYNLTTVSVGMTSPVAIASEVFPNRANSILYVPKGSRPAYKAANYWKEFKQIIELEDGVPVKCEKPTITFFASGKIKVESATEGAKCITNITASNVEPLTDGEISLNTPLTIYTVKAYATAEGYADSDEATATFRYEKTNGDMNGDGTVNIADVVQLVNMILGN